MTFLPENGSHDIGFREEANQNNNLVSVAVSFLCDPDRLAEQWSIAELHHLYLLTDRQLVYEHVKDADWIRVTVVPFSSSGVDTYLPLRDRPSNRF